MDMWMSLDEEQQKTVTDLLQNEGGFSMDSLKNLYDRLEGGTNIEEWKPAQGSVSDLPTQITVPKDVKVQTLSNDLADRKYGTGWMGDANFSHVIEMREGLSAQQAREILAHEFGHQLSSNNRDLERAIMSNPENVFGRYNNRVMGFDSRYSYTPEEAFAESFSYFIHHNDYVKKNDPKLHDYYSKLLKNNPSIRTELNKLYRAYGV